MRKKAQKNSRYIIYSAALVIYLIVCLLVFFGSLQVKIKDNIQKSLTEQVINQQKHIELTIEQEMERLVFLADYAGKQESLVSGQMQQLMRSLEGHSRMDKTYVIDASGKAYQNDGRIFDVSNRVYFVEGMQGRQVIAESEASLTAEDGYDCMLAVPVKDEKGSCIGVLGGSYHMSNLSRLLFENLYQDEGLVMISKEDGTLVSVEQRLHQDRDQDFFEYCSHSHEMKDSVLAALKQDFSERKHGCISDGRHYLAYVPMQINDWILCYFVTARSVHADYDFFHVAEMWLMIALMTGLLIFTAAMLLQLRKKQGALREKAQRDPLTQLYNKECTEKKIMEALQATEHSALHAVIMLDLDDFKKVNDSYGHMAGDEVLRRVSGVLKASFRPDDIVGRVGGDEFMIMMLNVRSKMDTYRKLERVREQIAGIRIEEYGIDRVSCSIGAAIYPEHGRTLEELYRSADERLYRAKQSGKQCVYQERNEDHS